LRKISPKLFCGLYNNVSIIKNIYHFIVKNNKSNVVKDYLTFFDANTSNIDTYCDNIMKFIKQNIDLVLAEEIELTQTQNFDINFINRGVDTDLDNKKDTIKASEEKLEAIKNYLNCLILDKGKTNEFIKIHETEKNNFSLICTSRRCKLLEDNLPQTAMSVKLKLNQDSNEEFDSAIANDEFLEWAEFAGNRYGTPRKAVENALVAGKNVLLEIEISGAKQVRSHSSEALLVFLEPPSWEELVSRLEGRGTDSPERRAARLALAQEELAAASLFDTVIINTQVEEVVSTLIRLAIS
jgi:guanylate kinase